MNVLDFFKRVGLLADGMTSPRELRGPVRVAAVMVAVAFSSFFIYISYFGPPVAEIFKGTYILGVAVLSLLMFRGRERSVREGAAWLDELIALVCVVGMCALIGLAAYWYLFDRVALWRELGGAGATLALLSGAAIGLALYLREATRPAGAESPTATDWLYIVCATGAIVWWAQSNVELAERLGSPVPVELVISSGLLAAVSFEIARRIVGPVIPIIGLVFLVYAFAPVAQASPGLFYHPGFRIARIAEFLMLEADGMTGLIIEVFATYIVIFVILGAFLQKTGLGELFIDATFRATGHRTGGPGLTAVVSSGMFGMISGSGVANVVTTGTFTIPLMKRVGYRPEFAGAVEAAASTGGAYMPPIMGAGAFLLAQLTETSYFEIVKIALIPAILYYLSVGFMVYIRAVHSGLHGVPVAELPPWARILPRLHLLLPIPVMVYFLIAGDSAFLAGVKTIFLIVLLKAADLLAALRTRWSKRMAPVYLVLAILTGLFAYSYGLQFGAPFSWFADPWRGLNAGDALFWVIAAYLALKTAEIVFAAARPVPGAAGALADEALVAGREAWRGLREAGVELVRVIWSSLETGAKNTLIVGCIAGVLGILLSSATQSDLPGRISSLLLEFSFGLLPLTIFWVIVAGYVVGMGLPITASYVILVIFGVSALTNQGVPTIAAHLICYWVAVTSAVTPPVALAAYAASAIAGSDPVRTGFEAVKLASWIYIMPFLFVYTPLLLDGTTFDITMTVSACLVGIVAWAGCLEGYLVRPTSAIERALLGISAVCLLLPVDHLLPFFFAMEGEFHYHTYGLGVVALVATLLLQQLRRRVDRPVGIA